MAEEEASLLAQKAADAERENARLRLSAIKTEEEKVRRTSIYNFLLYVFFVLDCTISLVVGRYAAFYYA